jgi:hypothetical protein
MRVILSFLLSTITYFGIAQKSTLSPPEKIYIQTDKPYYAPGDTLYFSAFLYNSIARSKTPLSKVVYVDFISPDDSILMTKRIIIEDLLGSGDFELVNNLESGPYMIRAYTNFMRNFSSDHFFYQELRIIATDFSGDVNSLYKDPIKKRLEISPIGRPSVDVKVEGGVLLERQSNNLVFRVTDEKGNGIAVDGEVLDVNGHPLGALKTYDFGLGIALLPASSSIPTSLSLNIGGVEEVYPLNLRFEEGYHIRVTNRGKSILLNLESSPNLQLSGNKIVGISAGKIIFEKVLEKKDNVSFSTRLLTSELETGVITFYLLDKNEEPLLKRKTFYHSFTKIPQLTISTEKELYTTRENLMVNIKPSELFSDSIAAYLNLAIRDINKADPSGFDQSLTESLFINDKIEDLDLNYLFRNKIPTQKDLFILDLGLARENAAIIKQDYSKEEMKYSPELGIIVKGYTSELNKPDKPFKCNILFDVFGVQFFHEEASTNEGGEFSFGPFYFLDTINVILQARAYEEEKYNKKGDLRGSNKVSIWLDEKENSVPVVVRPTFSHYEKEVDGSIDNYLNNRKQIDQYAKQFLDLFSVDLDEVTIKKRRLEKLTEEEKAIKKAPGIYSQPSNRIVVDDISRGGAGSVFDLLRRVPGVTVFGNFPSQSARIRGVSTLTGSNEPLYLLDNIPVDADAINFLSVNEVWFVDVLKGPKAAIFGNRGSTGVISVFTLGANKRPSNFSIKRQPGIADFQLAGFSKSKKYTIPDYTDKPRIISPDLRTLLFWEPRLIIKGKDAVEIPISTCDNPGDYLISLEGVDNNGRLIREEKIIRVR